MNKVRRNNILFTAFVAGIVGYWLITYLSYRELKENSLKTIGTIIEVAISNNRTVYDFKYEYHVKKVRYTGITSISTDKIDCTPKSNCIGKKYYVQYAVSSPDNSLLLYEEEIIDD